eukprot:16102225-Heterocapsa_arctica.AAC.1
MAKDYIMKGLEDMDFGNIEELPTTQVEFETEKYDDPITDMEVLVKHNELGEGICVQGNDFGCFDGSKHKLCW